MASSGSAPQNCALFLSTPGRKDVVSLQQASDPEGSNHEDFLSAIRVTSPHVRKALLVAVALVEIEELTRVTLDEIAENLEDPKTVRNWNLNRYNLERLQDPGDDLTMPDAYFCRFGSTKSRVILRVAAKGVLHKVKLLPDLYRNKLISSYDSLPLHRQIDDFVRRYDQRIELESEARRCGPQDPSLVRMRGKWQQEAAPDQSAEKNRPTKRRKRQAVTEPPNVETLLQPQAPSAAATTYTPSLSILQQASSQTNNLPYIHVHAPDQLGPAPQRAGFQGQQTSHYSNIAQDRVLPEEQQVNGQQQLANEADNDFDANFMTRWGDPRMVDDFIGSFEYR